MGWATKYIDALLAGNTVQFRPHGNSMTGRVDSGQLCTVEPVVDHTLLEVNDVVLCKVRGAQYLHLIKAVRTGQYQIGNNRGGVNGWVTATQIFGKLVKVEK